MKYVTDITVRTASNLKKYNDTLLTVSIRKSYTAVYLQEFRNGPGELDSLY